MQELTGVGADVSLRPRLNCADAAELTEIHNLRDGRLPGGDRLPCAKPTRSENHIGRPHHIEALGAGGRTLSSQRSERGDDRARLRTVDDANALVAGFEAYSQEWQEDLVPLLNTSVKTTQVLSRLEFNSLEAQIDGHKSVPPRARSLECTPVRSVRCPLCARRRCS